MTINRDKLREIEPLLREALAKLEPDGAFRQKVLLQMALYEVERDLGKEERQVQAGPPASGDAPKDRIA